MRRQVALVRLEGTIGVSVRANDFVPLFDSLRKRRRTRAVVVDIDSRGGSAAASDYIYDALRRLAQEKPVVAFAGNICASGGYLIACAARRIVVQPGALIGSIGVISMRPLAGELMRRTGLDMAVAKSGRLKDMGAFWRAPTEEERAKDQSLVDEYFDLFLERVETGRSLERKRLRDIATGEVFTGRQAVPLHLADQLGTLEDAIAISARLAAVNPRVRPFSPRRSLRQRLLGPLTTDLSDRLIETTLALSAEEPRY